LRNFPLWAFAYFGRFFWGYPRSKDLKKWREWMALQAEIWRELKRASDDPLHDLMIRLNESGVKYFEALAKVANAEKTLSNLQREFLSSLSYETGKELLVALDELHELRRDLLKAIEDKMTAQTAVVEYVRRMALLTGRDVEGFVRAILVDSINSYKRKKLDPVSTSVQTMVWAAKNIDKLADKLIAPKALSNKPLEMQRNKLAEICNLYLELREKLNKCLET